MLLKIEGTKSENFSMYDLREKYKVVPCHYYTTTTIDYLSFGWFQKPSLSEDIFVLLSYGCVNYK